MHQFISFLITGALALVAHSAAADPIPPRPPIPPPPLSGFPVGTSMLEQTRGGFTTQTGLMVAIGIERVVSVNGVVMARSHVEVTDLARLTSEQAGAIGNVIGARQLVQIGKNNNVAFDGSAGLGATIVQNSLDDQTIRTQTIVTSTVNSMSLLKDMNFQGSVRDALIGASGSF